MGWLGVWSGVSRYNGSVHGARGRIQEQNTRSTAIRDNSSDGKTGHAKCVYHWPGLVRREPGTNQGWPDHQGP